MTKYVLNSGGIKGQPELKKRCSLGELFCYS